MRRDANLNKTAPGGIRTHDPRFRKPVDDSANSLIQDDCVDCESDPTSNPTTSNENATTCADLRHMIEAWPTLPKSTRMAILELIEAAKDANG